MARIDRPDLEALTAPVKTLMATQLASMELSPRHQELVILAVAHSLNAPAVVAQRPPILRSSGVTDRERVALSAGAQWDLAMAFDPTETAFIRFALAVLEAPKVSDKTFLGMRQHFSDREIVETIRLVGQCFTIAKLTSVLEAGSDTSGTTDAFDTGIHFARAE